MLATFAALVSGAANGYYGFSGDPAHMEGWGESTIVPLNPYMLRMRQPDGVERILQRDPAQPEVLKCPPPWVGEVRGSQIVVMTDPELKDGQTGFLFKRGRLEMMILDGKEYKVPAGRPIYASIRDLWPKITKKMVRAVTNSFRVHWKGRRFTLFYENPNRTAMLLVEVMLLLFATFRMRGRLGVAVKLLALPIIAVSFYGLVRTGSRGGMVALMIGLAGLFVFHLRSLLRLRNFAVFLLMLAALAAIVYFSGASARFTSGLVHEGYTDVSRIPIWVEAPRMMVSAPWGWGWRQSGEAYINWFQPLTRFYVPGGFLNTHLNVLVDTGWPIRYIYLFAWAFALACFADAARRGYSSMPFAMGLAFFVGMIFNSLGNVPSLWIAPLFAVSVYLCSRPWAHCRNLRIPLFFAAGAACIVLGVFAFFGARAVRSAGIDIHGDGSRVVVNGKDATAWVVYDGQVLDGGYKGILGKDVRMWYSRHASARAVGFAKKLGDVPPGVRRLVLAGKVCSAVVDGNLFDNFTDLKEVVLISPPFGWREIPESVRSRFRMRMVMGDIAQRLSDGSEYPQEWVSVIPGCELYIPNWMRYAAN